MADAAPKAVPLCVDLDGTLVRTDMLHELTLLLARSNAAALASIPGWLAGGRARLKHMIAEQVSFDAAGLPYRQDVLDLIGQARAAGRPVILATAAPAKVARAIAEHLGVFDEVLSSDRNTNLSARAKAEALVARFGEDGFDYIGNHRDDLPVLAKARQAYLVSSRGSLRRAAGGHPNGVHFIDDPVGGLKTWAKALRVHQWLKNLLVLVPIAAAHQFGDLDLLWQSIVGFLAFSLCASSVYILNDLLDLAADRAHRNKKNRPFASGALPVSAGVVAAPLLLAAALGLALLLPIQFLLVLGIYYTLTSLYSFWLKRQVVVDVMLLASLYTIRIVAGAAATGIPLSFWLLAFSMFIFLCLAMVKRYSELQVVVEDGRSLAGRGYQRGDLPVVLALGSGSGMVSVLVLAMYTQSAIVPENYPVSEWLWLPPLLVLYWITRLWLKAQRGEVHDDPVVFAAKDWQSLVVAALLAVSFALAAAGARFW